MDSNDYEVVIISTPLPDEFGHELSTAAVEKTDAGVILLAKTGTAEQIADKLQDFGVLVLGKPFTAVQFRQAVQIAASNYKRLAVLRAENAKLLDKIAQLRLVDRAKCYLIEKKGMTETEAHRLIEKGAMDTRRQPRRGRAGDFGSRRGRVTPQAFPLRGKVAEGPARGRMRGECAGYYPLTGWNGRFCPHQPPAGGSFPRGGSLSTRGCFRVLYTHISGVPTINPAAIHQRHGRSATDQPSQMPSTPIEERQGQNRHDLEQQRAQKADGR